ncbi:cyclic nucleotide-binding domain-containing protein [candidate division KSB1 bacterium]|nr:cyclic nucleotide-binding domain-containing protein [candidate division KSB1 bacterium]
MRFEKVLFLRSWDVLLAVSVSCAALATPLRIVLNLQQHNLAFYVDALLTVIFGIDIVLRMLRRREPQATPAQDSPSQNNAGYPLVWLALDVLAALPLNLIFGNVWWQTFRLLKLARVGQFMRQWRKRAVKSANVLKLAFFLYWLLLSVHWIACGWLALRGVTAGSEWSNYLRALYWTIQTFSTVGYGDLTPATDAQTVYAIVVMLIGVGVYGYIIGNVASLLANIDPAKVQHLHNLDKLSTFMNYRSIPPEIQKRIRDYYDYLWEKRLSYDESTVISELPPSLKTEVSLFLKRDIIAKVPLFQDASEEFVKEIALQMKPLVFMPGDYVYRAGEPGRDMYFISKGTIEVVSKDGKQVYAMLTDGDFFGEIALVLNEPRTASVRALTFCDLYRLDKEAFEHVLVHHPEIGIQITSKAQTRRANN